jgi:hypothetical protein
MAVSGGAGHEGCLRRGEEADDAGDLLGPADALHQRRAVEQAAARLRVGGLVDALLQQGRQSRAGADAVDADAVAGMVDRQRLCQLHHPALGRDIDRQARRADQAEFGGDGDDGALRWAQQGQGGARAQDGAAQVDRDHRVDFLDADLLQGAAPVDAGVVDQDVEAAEAVGDRVEQRRDAAGIADVGTDCDGPARQGCGKLLAGRPVGHDHGRALARKPFGRGKADAARRAGHHRDPACEIQACLPYSGGRCPAAVPRRPWPAGQGKQGASRGLRTACRGVMLSPMNKIAPLGGPPAWTGDDLRADESGWRRPLSDTQIAEIEAALRHARGAGVPWHQVTRKDFPLDTLGRELEAVSDELENGRGIIQLKGVPVAGKSPEENKTMFMGLSSWLGTPVYQSAKGEILGEIRDEGPDVGLMRGQMTNPDGTAFPAAALAHRSHRHRRPALRRRPGRGRR